MGTDQMEDVAATTAHVLVVPLPLEGHLRPMLSLTHFLASAGVSLTLVLPSHSPRPSAEAAPLIRPAISAASLHPSSAFAIEVVPWDFDLLVPFSMTSFIACIHRTRTHVTHLLQRLVLQQETPVSCLLTDSFFSWGASFAEEFGLSHVVLYTSPAAVFCLGCHVPDIVTRGFIPPADQDTMDEIVDFVPGLSPFRVSDMPKNLLALEGLQSESFLFFTSRFQNARYADRVLVNTMYELERSVIEALRKEDHTHILPVGPLFMMCNMAPARQLHEEDNSCLAWLDQQRESSVLYIAFGTRAPVLQQEVLAELAHALVQSEETFLWVMRPDTYKGKESVEAVLPEGFMERTRGRGMVITWAPQLAVLGHSSVGGFLTHCGWNSVMESLSNGVPMLGFPQDSEQNFNLKLLVHDWKVGLPLLVSAAEREDIGPQEGGSRGAKVERRGVRRAIAGMMRGEEGREVRRRARQWKGVAAKASEEGGDSHANLQKLANDLKQGLFIRTPTPSI